MSILKVRENDVVPPGLVAVHATVVSAVSVLRTWFSHVVLTADSGSVTTNEIETLLRYQLLVPAVPVIVGVMTGAVVSVTE